MGRLKKEVAQARDQFLAEWEELAKITEEQLAIFRRLILDPSLNLNGEFIDRYIDTSIKVAAMYREVAVLLGKKKLKEAQDVAFEALVLQEKILDKYADFFNPLISNEELLIMASSQMTLTEYRTHVQTLIDSGVDDDVIFSFTYMACENNLPLFCYVMLSHMFYKPIGEVHREIMDSLTDKDCTRQVTAIPRKHGKTTIIKAFVLWCIAYNKFTYIVWLGDTIDKVSKQLTNVKHELSTNAIYRQVYGDVVKPAKKWNDAEILLENGFHLIAAGQHYKFRGLLDIKPPDLLLVDDLDDDETVENPNSRNKLDSWFYNSAMIAIDQDDGVVKMFGTVIHNDSQLMRIIQNPEFKAIVYGCCDEEKETALDSER